MNNMICGQAFCALSITNYPVSRFFILSLIWISLLFTGESRAQGQYCPTDTFDLSAFEFKISTETGGTDTVWLDLFLNPLEVQLEEVTGVHISLQFPEIMENGECLLDLNGSWFGKGNECHSTLEFTGSAAEITLSRYNCESVSGKGLFLTMCLVSSEIPESFSSMERIHAGGIVVMENISPGRTIPLAPIQKVRNWKRIEYYSVSGELISTRLSTEERDPSLPGGLYIYRKYFHGDRIETGKVFLK